MKKRHHVTRVLMILSLLFISGACSSTKIFSKKAPDLKVEPFNKVVVMGFFDSLEDRKVFENNIAEALNQAGCDAKSSLSLIEGGKKYTKEELAKLFTEQGFNGVLILRIADVEEERTNIPENYYFPLEPFVYSWYPYWSGSDGLGLLMRGGYHERHDVISVESALFSLSSEKLVWVAQSETTRVKTVAALATHLGPSLAKKLKKEKLIP